MSKVRQPPAIFAAVLALGACCIAAAAFVTFKTSTTDFLAYYCAAQMIAHGHAPQLYIAKMLAVVEHQVCPSLAPGFSRPFLYPPYTLLFVSVLKFFSYKQAAALWSCLLVGSLAASMLIMKRTFELAPAVKPWFPFAVLVSGPAIWSLATGQPSPLLLVSICAAVWALKAERNAIAGVALASLLVKPHEALPMVLYLLGARRFVPLAFMAAVLAGLTAVSLLVFGPSVYQAFFNCMSLYLWTSRATDLDTQAGPTLRGVLLRLWGNSELVSIITVLALVSIYIFIIWFGNRMRKSPLWLEFGLLTSLPLGFAFALHFQSYDQLLLVPAAAALLSKPLAEPETRLIKIAALVALIIFSAPIFLPLHVWWNVTGMLNPFFFLIAAFGAFSLWLIRKKSPPEQRLG